MKFIGALRSPQRLAGILRDPGRRNDRVRQCCVRSAPRVDFQDVRARCHPDIYVREGERGVAIRNANRGDHPVGRPIDSDEQSIVLINRPDRAVTERLLLDFLRNRTT